MNLFQKFINRITSKQILFRFGNYIFLYYGLIISIVIFIFYLFGTFIFQIFNIDNKFIFLWIIFTIPSIAIFSRVLPLILNFRLFLKQPKEVLEKEWFTYLGGFLGLFVSGVLILFYLDIPFEILKVSDAIGIFAPFAHMIGRFASINYGCCGIGKVNKKIKGIFFSYQKDYAFVSNVLKLKNKKLIPIHLYEISLNFILGLILIFIFILSSTHGWVAGTYLIGYGFIRIILEPYRLENKKILFKKYSLYQIFLTTTFILFGLFYYFLAYFLKDLIIFTFYLSYFYISLSYIPLIFIMSFLAFILFGVRKVNKF